MQRVHPSCNMVAIPFVAMAVLVSMVTKADKTITDRMYLHTELNINCLKCPPGFYRTGHCTNTSLQAQCEPCKDGYFQTDYTLAKSCQKCQTSCKLPDREYLVLNCTSITDNYCLCREGLYRSGSVDGVCINHIPCPVGEGVTKVGTQFEKTECEKCPSGFFSPNESLTQICQPCAECPEGKKPKRICPATRDTECVPEHDDNLPVILGVIGAVAAVVLIMLAVMCFCARSGRGPKCMQKLWAKGDSDSFDLESPEKRPLSDPTTHNGMTNGDMLDNPHNHNGHVSEDSESAVPDKILVQLSHDLLCPEWQFFMRYLIGESADNMIDESVMDNKYVRDQIYRLLKKWKAMKKDKACMDDIIEALRKWGNNELVQKYQKFSQKQSTCTDV